MSTKSIPCHIIPKKKFMNESPIEKVDITDADMEMLWGGRVYENDHYVEYENGIIKLKCSMGDVTRNISENVTHKFYSEKK